MRTRNNNLKYPPTPTRAFKILMPVPIFDEISGGWTYFKEMALRLDNLGYEIIILSPHLRVKKHRDEIRGIKIYRYSTIKFPQIPLIFNPISFISVLIKVMRLEKNIDLVYDTSSGILPSLLFIKLYYIIKNKKIPIIIHVLGEFKSFKLKNIRFLYELYLNIITRFNYFISDKILLAGKKIAPRVIRLGANPNKLKTIRIGLKYENEMLKNPVILDKKEIMKIKNSFGINEKDFVIGYVGRLESGKGLETLFRAIAIAKKRLLNIKLVIIGDGELNKNLFRLSSKLRMQDITLFLGYRDDVPNLLQMMDLFVNLSISEADISATQLEAMKYGLPSIITPFTEMVDNMKETIFVPFNNVQAVNNAILFMYNNEELRRRIGHNASVKSAKLVQKYTWNSYLNGVICTFEEIIEEMNRLI